MKWFSKKNNKKIIASFIILTYLYLTFWSMCMSIVYRPLFKAIGGSMISGNAYQHEEEYTYGVSAPYFMHFTGNIYISPDAEIGKKIINFEPSFGVMIWPKLFGNYDVAVTCEYPAEESTATNYIQVTDCIYLNEDMELSNWNIETDPYENHILYEQYYDEIKKVYQMVYDKWGILEPK